MADDRAPDQADDDQPDDEGDEDVVPRSHIRELEKQAKRARDLEARLAERERRDIFHEALPALRGEPRLNYFMSGYEGEMDVEAIRQAAIRDGFIPDPDAAPDSSLDAAARMAGASQGAGEPGPRDLHREINSIPHDDPAREDKILDILEAAGVPTTRSLQ